LVRRALTALLGLTLTVVLRAEPVSVRHPEGIVHGFLTLSTLDGTLVANGDLIQNMRGNRVTSRLVFHFKDGSLSDETAVYSQRGSFRLWQDHLIQKGPTFPHQIDMTLDSTSGKVVVRYTDDGKEKTETEQMKLPPDLANGMTLTLLKNVSPASPPGELAMVVATPKPRLVKLKISSAGTDRFTTGTMGRSAAHYVVKIDIGGLTGLVAPIVGKQPPDTHVWVLEGEAPAFIKSEGPMFQDGPIWRIELVSPVWKR
jgi:hypothetical protein